MLLQYGKKTKFFSGPPTIWKRSRILQSFGFSWDLGQNLTLSSFASWSFMSTAQFFILVCWLKRNERFDSNWEEWLSPPDWEEADNGVKLVFLTELGGLPGQLGTDMDTLGIKLRIGFLEFFSDVDTLLPWACRAPHGSWCPCCRKYLALSQELPCEP